METKVDCASTFLEIKNPKDRTSCFCGWEGKVEELYDGACPNCYLRSRLKYKKS